MRLERRSHIIVKKRRIDYRLGLGWQQHGKQVPKSGSGVLESLLKGGGNRVTRKDIPRYMERHRNETHHHGHGTLSSLAGPQYIGGHWPCVGMREEKCFMESCSPSPLCS